MRQQIRKEVSRIDPFDELEARDKREVLAWIDSGAELCRIQKPDVPPKHLISYFVVVDDDHILLGDHVKAERWLPAGGHVELFEHPRTTVIREALEELGLDAEFVVDHAIFVSVTKTVGKTAGHTDVSLWYALKGSRENPMKFDRREFHGIRWFHKDAVPPARSDPQLGRFVRKFYTSQIHPR